MSDPASGTEQVPRKVLYAVAALIGFSLIAVTAARLSGWSTSQVAASPAVQVLDLRFEDGPNGGVVVQDARTAQRIAELPPASNGFVRGVLRSMARERRANRMDGDQPFRLARHADGRLTLEDLATGRVIELNSFGPTNEGAFAALLEQRSGVATP